MNSIPDWRGGRLISATGRKKILRGAGVMSKSGDTAELLRGFSRFLEASYGYSDGDFLELTYRGRANGSDWSPAPYLPTDCDAPLARSTEVVVRQLRWYDARL